MLWNELRKLGQDADAQGVLRWLISNAHLVERQIVGERLQKVFGVENAPVKFYPDEDLSPYYDSYTDRIGVGGNWKCSDEVWSLLLSRTWGYDVTINEDNVEYELKFKDSPRIVGDAWDRYPHIRIYGRILCRPDATHGCTGQVQVELHHEDAEIRCLEEGLLPEKLTLTQEMSLVEFKAKASELYQTYREALFEYASSFEVVSLDRRP